MSKDTNPWRFVEKLYPKYHSSYQIALADDLSKLTKGEVNGDAEEMLHRDYGGDIKNPQIQIDYDTVHRKIYEEAIENFLESSKTKQKHHYLFGEQICRAYYDVNFEDILKMAKEKSDFDIFEYVENGDPSSLLVAADGWMGCATITEEEYKQLKALKEN